MTDLATLLSPTSTPAKAEAASIPEPTRATELQGSFEEAFGELQPPIKSPSSETQIQVPETDLEEPVVGLVVDGEEFEEAELPLAASADAPKRATPTEGTDVFLPAPPIKKSKDQATLPATDTERAEPRLVTGSPNATSDKAQPIQQPVERGKSTEPSTPRNAASTSEEFVRPKATREIEQPTKRTDNTPSKDAFIRPAGPQKPAADLVKPQLEAKPVLEQQKPKVTSESHESRATNLVEEVVRYKSAQAPVPSPPIVHAPKTVAAIEVSKVMSASLSGDAAEALPPIMDELGPISTTSRQETVQSAIRFEGPTQAAKQISQQVAYAVSQNSPGTTEIKLSPEELGRVRMTVQTVEGMVTITVVAERVEVGDLMRRHSDTLAEALKNMGFETINLSFGNEGRAPQEGMLDGGIDAETTDEALQLEEAEQRWPQRMKNDALDIRI